MATTGNIFKDIAIQFGSLVTPTPIARPGGPLGQVLASAQKAGEEIREEIGKPIAESITALASKVPNIFAKVGQVIDELYGTPGKLAIKGISKITPSIISPIIAEEVPKGFSEQVEELVTQTTGVPSLGLVAGFAAGIAEPLGRKGRFVKITKELEPLAQEARKYKSTEEFVKGFRQNDFSERMKTGQELIKDFKGAGVKKSLNPDGTITIFHGTSKANEQIILKNGIFNEGTFFSPFKQGTRFGDSPLDVARRGFGKEGTVMEIKVDPRDIGTAAAGSELFAEKQLIRGIDNIWRAVNRPTISKIGDTPQQLTDFYNQAVKGIKEIPLKEPQLGIEVTRTIADEAIDFAKKNPDSSLVAKEFRNPRTKELESGPLLFKRIGQSIENGEINITELPNLVRDYGLTTQQTAQLFEDAATFSGRTLQALSRVEKELRSLLPDIQLPKREPTVWEKFKSGYLAIDNFRRSLLVTQLATAARNAISQAGRYSLESVNDSLSGAISKFTGKGTGFTPFFEDIAAILRKTDKNNWLKIEKALQRNPLENARLYNTPVSDVALSNKISNFFNTLNRAQEYFFRNLILDAKLHTASKIKKVPIEKLGVDDIESAVSDALEWTYSKSPERGTFGDAIMRAYRAMPPLTLINPFPRFMSNAVKFLYDYSPAGVMSLFSSKTKSAIAAGDYRTISKAVIGTSMLGAAITIRSNENLAGEKWYEIKVGDKTLDSRPFAPFSTYLLFGEVMTNGTEKITGSDWAQAAIGINRVAGTGLALVDLISGRIDAKNAKDIINNIVSSYIGGFTVPFLTIKDIIGNFKLEERTIKETREIPIIGGAIGNIPGLNEILPVKYSLFEDKPLQREQSLLRQLTGLTLKKKSFIEKELDRLGKQIGDIVPKTGNLEANRIITKQTGIILDRFNEKLELSEKYQAMDDFQKLEFLKELISEAKSEAKGEMASDLAGVVYNELKKHKSEKRKEVTKQLKNRGLLTENILDYLLPMVEAQPLSK